MLLQLSQPCAHETHAVPAGLAQVWAGHDVHWPLTSISLLGQVWQAVPTIT